MSAGGSLSTGDVHPTASPPALWWPFGFGSPELYQLEVSFEVGRKVSDSQSIKFGIRQITDYLTPPMYDDNTYKGFKVNGQNILIRGGAYVWDMFMRWDTATNEAHMRYVKDMGLNTVRFEGNLGNEEIYDIADREGILLMPGFVCCSQWERWSRWTPENYAVAYASLESQMRAMRHHASASLCVWKRRFHRPTCSPSTRISPRLRQNPTFDNVATIITPTPVPR
jgi:exo-1,4-beta-D-glucosaminidase